MTEEERTRKVEALLEERRGYELRGLEDRVEQVDDELNRLGPVEDDSAELEAELEAEAAKAEAEAQAAAEAEAEAEAAAAAVEHDGGEGLSRL